ncbi:hypothetical protein CBS101457_006838 [Exobasidium rhododendri]|nr:hypothetical protein CBS101457_006838 [Exobasidium rhododendri]
MACSQYAYVRSYEQADPVLPNTYMVVRIDGKGFHKFSKEHDFEKPNDGLALELMNKAAQTVMNELRPDVTLSFGESDEYSFLLRRSCSLYNRRQSKLVTHIVSLFTSSYVYHWNDYFPQKRLKYPPSFDGRLVVYPGEKEVIDYFAWRQADTHINNLHNTTYWSLILQGNMSETQAHVRLDGTDSSDKNEILFQDFRIKYGTLPAMFRKGTTLAWDDVVDGARKKSRSELRALHVDIIASSFWRSVEGGDADRKAERTSAAKDPQEAVWQRQDRLLGSAGLGRRALES